MEDKTMDELRAEIEKMILQYNESIDNGEEALDFNKMLVELIEREDIEDAINDLEGYAMADMFEIMNGNLWKEDSIVRTKKVSNAELQNVPIMKQAEYLINLLLAESKIKLTATEALPPKHVKAMHALGVPDIVDVSIRYEADSITVQLVRILMGASKLVMITKGIMTLTMMGQAVAHNKQKLFEMLLTGMTTEFNFGYFDMFDSDNAAGFGNGFSLILLSKYGDKERETIFYSDKYYAAFPDMLEEFTKENTDYPEDIPYYAEYCYFSRTFKRYMEYFGLVTIRKERKLHASNEKTFIKKTPLFDKIIEIRAPKEC